jgi:hypothetical protein
MATNARIIVIDMSGQYLIANNNTFIGNQITLLNTTGAQINNFKTLDDLRLNINARWQNLDILGQIPAGMNRAQTLDTLSNLPGAPAAMATPIPYFRMYTSGKHVFNWLKINILTHNWLNSPAVALGAYSRGIPPQINCSNDEIRLAFEYSCTNFPALDINAFQNGLSKIKLILKTEQVNFIGGELNPSDFNPYENQPRPYCDRNIDETILREFLEETGTDLSPLVTATNPIIVVAPGGAGNIYPTMTRATIQVNTIHKIRDPIGNYQLYFLKVDDTWKQRIKDNYINNNFYQNSEAFNLRFAYESSFNGRLNQTMTRDSRETLLSNFKLIVTDMPDVPPTGVPNEEICEQPGGRFGALAGTRSGWSSFGSSGQGKGFGSSGQGKKPNNFPGGGDPFYNKYIKYKTKYIKLKEAYNL